HRFARGQQRRPRSSLRIARPKVGLCGAGALARVALQQSLRMFRREPSAVFCDADRNHFVFGFINCVQNGGRREQRHFMLATASAKEDANPNLCHELSVWRSPCFPSIAGLVPAEVGGWWPSVFLPLPRLFSLQCLRLAGYYRKGLGRVPAEPSEKRKHAQRVSEI